MKTKVEFIPNQESPIPPVLEHATNMGFNPEDVVTTPFSEVEEVLLNQLPSNVTVAGSPVLVDVIGNQPRLLVKPEKTTKMGEKLADELESFTDLDYCEVVNTTMTHIVGGTPYPVTVLIKDEEAIKQLESFAKGEK